MSRCGGIGTGIGTETCIGRSNGGLGNACRERSHDRKPSRNNNRLEGHCTKKCVVVGVVERREGQQKRGYFRVVPSCIGDRKTSRKSSKRTAVLVRVPLVVYRRYIIYYIVHVLQNCTQTHTVKKNKGTRIHLRSTHTCIENL